MQGASRVSFLHLRERLAAARTGHGSGEQVGQESAELFAVASLLGREASLLSSLTDPSTSPETKAQIVRAVLGGRIGPASVEIVAEAAQLRWSRQHDLADIIESLGAEAAFARAEAGGSLDRIEEDLFRFSRLVIADSRLRYALTDPVLPLEGRTSLVRTLLEGRADDTTVALVVQVVGSLRGRRLEEALEVVVELAAARRSEVVAVASVAAPLTAEQETRLTDVLTRIYGTAIRLSVEVDPAVLGGVVVRVGDEVVDGSVLHRIEQARQSFTR